MKDSEAPVKLDMQELKRQSDAVTDDSLESTRRMLTYCENSKDAGIKTLVALDEQREQLERVEEDMDRINDDMRQAQKNLSALNKCCSICLCPCIKSKRLREDNETWRGSNDGGVVSGEPIRIRDERNGAFNPAQCEFFMSDSALLQPILIELCR